MTVDRRALAVALATLLLVAACGGGATSAPTAAPGDTPAPGVTDAPTQEPTETPEPAATDGGSGPGGGPGTAVDLEALLPSEVNGIAFDKASFDGGAFPGGIPIGEGDDEFRQFLEANGKSIDDLRVAVASATSSDAAGTLVMAIQVDGIPSDKLLTYAAADMADQKTTIAGKDVYGSGMAGFAAYVYPKGDTVFYVLSVGGADLAEGIISQLP